MKKRKVEPSPASAPNPPANTVVIGVYEDENPEERSTKVMLGPHVTNAAAIVSFGRRIMAEPKVAHVVTALQEVARKVRSNDMSDVEATLVSQAMALNVMFGDLSRRAEGNLAGGYFEAGERYLRLALKAQSQCRTTLESLSAIKNPPVVYARQANIAHGPQQVNNGQAAPTRAGETEKPPSKLLEPSHEQPVDTRTPGPAGQADPSLEAMATIDRPEDT